MLAQAVYVPADDMTDPAPATTFIHLDATTVLARSLAAKGIYPAVDVCCKVAARGMRHLAGRDRWSAPWASMVGYAMTGLQPAYDILEAPRPLL